jgi:hypothetical protein
VRGTGRGKRSHSGPSAVTTGTRGIKVTDAELAAAPREAHAFHGEWNDTCNGTA